MAHASLSLRAGGHLGITPCTSTARRPVPFSAGAGGCRHAVSVCRAPTHCRRSAADEPAAADDAGLAALFSQTVRVKGIPSPVAAVQSAQPSPLVPPHAVVHQILDVLQRNDYPDQDAGVTAAFQLTAPAEDPQHAGTVRSWFAGGESWLPLPRFHALLHTAYRPLLNCDSWRPLSPLVFPSTRCVLLWEVLCVGADVYSVVGGDVGMHAGTVRSWFAGGESWLPLPRFHALLHTAYRPLLNCDSWRPLSPLVFPSTRHDNKAVQAVEVMAKPRHGAAAASGSALRPYTYTFCLERLENGPCKDCWMVAGVRMGNYAL
ncbi:hypothetical protein CHLRE_12g536450v5 [Chlamydomonas reinhardtii]|uniref:Uncharacterized protein n=1 Tax=Chlamydomonas reinhardtii TaxID=3055 RepID=A0A2K3D571_CHLRE|nr:uncharacterized protein CHLRE_12g536450v5 [Chlamydomonas reinhardtii]PNW75675.1 hypothetical protein CHLRE_12g536450v5 [Chlamydomonas reinhardtii]